MYKMAHWVIDIYARMLIDGSLVENLYVNKHYMTKQPIVFEYIGGWQLASDAITLLEFLENYDDG